MELQTRALFVEDADARLTATRSLEGDPAPRFFLGLTALGNLWRFRQDLAPGTIRELARLAAGEPAGGASGLDALPERYTPILERLEAEAPVEHVFFGGAFRFPEALPDPGEAEAIGPEQAALVAEDFPDLVPDLARCQPCVGVAEGDRIVSICLAARRRAPVVEAGVYSVAGFRSRGFATRAAAAWARAVRARGETPLYSGSLTNRGSMGVARRLGLIRYGSDLHIR